MSHTKVVAIVVSFNRWNYLEQCLSALRSQTRPIDEIVVVDNGSTDGSLEHLITCHPYAKTYVASTNLGGAGGFAFGVDVALRLNADAIWLMDDDAEPLPDALEELLNLVREHPGAPMWTSTTWFYEGTVEQARQFRGLRPSTADQDLGHGSCPTREATFVGVLVNAVYARANLLPVADFFIWHDDTEYLTRLTRHETGWRSFRSKFIHPYKEIYSDFGDRLYYDLRNRIWILRDSKLASPDLRSGLTLRICKTIVRQGVAAKHKRTYARNVIAGLRDGIATRPRLLSPGSSIVAEQFRLVDNQEPRAQ